MTAEFRLLVIADSHYAVDYEPGTTKLCCDRGCELIGRAIEDARKYGFDAVALLGDLVNEAAGPDYEGTGPNFERELADIRRQTTAAAPDVPLLVVPGNHDRYCDVVLAAFGARAGLHEIGGYRFVVFADAYAEGDHCTRSEADLAIPADIAARPGGPIVTLQHSPISPEIDSSDYPYMHTNRGAIVSAYSHAGVLLSISGHYHAGQELNENGGVLYFTAPAVCEPPLPYTIVALRGRNVTIEPYELSECTPEAQRPAKGPRQP